MTTPRTKVRKLHIDLLLLSIIRAYDHPDRTSEAERLADARMALFGEKRGRGRASNFDDLAIFKVQDEIRKPETDRLRRALPKHNTFAQTLEWDAELAREPTKFREAAKKFALFAGGTKNLADDAVVDRVRRKARNPLTDREMAERESLFDPEDHHTRTVIAVLDFLKDLGVGSEKIWDKNP